VGKPRQVKKAKKKNFGWLYRRRAFWSLLTAQVILVISVAAAGIYTLTNNILWTLIVAILAFICISLGLGDP
jgi:uncharacterized membrane protein YdbT with pleckstrin-like domain